LIAYPYFADLQCFAFDFVIHGQIQIKKMINKMTIAMDTSMTVRR
jgi:hypothetical protein